VGKRNKVTGEWETTGIKGKTQKSTKMAEAFDSGKDAYALSSGTAIEKEYAEYANNMVALGRKARLEAMKTPNLKYDKVAAKTYEAEAKSLKNKVMIANSNKPYERQAQNIAAYLYKDALQKYPNLTNDQKKTLKGQKLVQARIQAGTQKIDEKGQLVPRKRLEITDREWDAIQSGAISNNLLVQILANTEKDKLVKRALPRKTPIMSEGKIARAKAMLANGYAQADIAEVLGVSISGMMSAIKGE